MNEVELTTKRKRKYKSKKDSLLRKSREAMLAAVEIYNNPLIKFKSETFLTLSVIAWTYLMHAFYEQKGIDYSYYEKKGKRKKYIKTDYGAIKKWELSKCIKAVECPLSAPIRANLEFIIGLRNEVEHQMTIILDQVISAKLQACALNYNHVIVELFGKKYSMENELVMSIQFSGINPLKQKELSKMKGLSENVCNYISDFEKKLPADILIDREYSYKLMFIPMNANNRGQADSVIEFVKVSNDVADQVKSLVMIKESEKKKYLPKQIVSIIVKEGYTKFTMDTHTKLWQNNGSSLKIPKYGSMVAGKAWYWYDTWLEYVKEYCKEHQAVLGYVQPNE